MCVSVVELSYVDPAAGNDKFYRVFTFGSTVAVQYGRTGTYGTFKRSLFATAAEAETSGLKQADGKRKKGYDLVKEVQVAVDFDPSDGDLDALASALPSTPALKVKATVDSDEIVSRWNADVAEVDGAVFDAVLAALTAAGVEYEVSSGKGRVAVRPMLAATAEQVRVESLLADDRWVAQPKLDGDRFVVEVADGVVAAYNRSGQLKTSNVAPALLEPFRQLHTDRWVFDGEVVGRTLYLFDVAACPGVGDLTPFLDRYRALAAVMSALAVPSDVVSLVDCASGEVAKRELLSKVVAESREGVMFRNASGMYEAGRRSTTLLKHKLLRTADCVVVETASKGKANATLAVFDTDGAMVEVGAVSTIGKGDVRVGDVVEVQFLYVVDPAYPRMFQPRMLRVRHDKAGSECSIEQFADAGTNKQW